MTRYSARTPAGTTAPDLLQMRRESEIELLLWTQIDQAGLCIPFWHRHVDGHECDFVWPGERIIVEVQGGTWTRGAHTRGAGYATDRMRANRYQIDGWMVLEFTTDQVRDLSALGVVRDALEARMYDDGGMDE